MLRKWTVYLISIMILFMEYPLISHGSSTIDKLYAQSAVLMDGDSGRILYAKNAIEEKPNASTTKILTCILALEKGDLAEYVSISEEAEAQPKVHLGVQCGEVYSLENLLYSLMLESHNDSAVAIAEHIGGSLVNFAALMNEKARDIGCHNSYFITPNGLDARDQRGIHHTTAEDLARIMRYCIMESECSNEFRIITKTKTHSFQDVEGTRNFTCNNHNALLEMMDGAMSGKTGFTNDAGYCYVGAVQKEGKTFVVALLACGWPNHKNYKWEDSQKLIQYGMEEFIKKSTEDFPQEKVEPKVYINKGKTASVLPKLFTGNEDENQFLVGRQEQCTAKINMTSKINAPVEKNTIVGVRQFRIDGKVVHIQPFVIPKEIKKKNILF